MTEEIIIDKEDKTKKHRNNEIDCLHFCCRKGESGNVLFWCDFYDDHCDNYTGCYYRKYLRLEQENKDFETLTKSLYKRIEELEKENEALAFRERFYKADYEASEQENKELKSLNKKICEDWEKAIKVYWNALEEIREYLNTLLSVDSDFPNTETYLRITNVINEVLNS